MNDSTKKIMFSSDRQDWETPHKFWKELHEKYNFAVDLAASHQNTKCPFYFTKEDNVLNEDWHKLTKGWMWLNPPYNMSKEFIQKCDEEAQKGAKIACLLPARTDTIAFHKHIYKKYEIDFLKGRLKFEINGNPILDKNGKPQSAPFPSMVIKFCK